MKKARLCGQCIHYERVHRKGPPGYGWCTKGACAAHANMSGCEDLERKSTPVPLPKKTARPIPRDDDSRYYRLPNRVVHDFLLGAPTKHHAAEKALMVALRQSTGYGVLRLEDNHGADQLIIEELSNQRVCIQHAQGCVSGPPIEMRVSLFIAAIHWMLHEGFSLAVADWDNRDFAEELCASVKIPAKGDEDV